MMKASERNLERLLKKVVKGQEVSAGELLSHWNELSGRGDRTVIRALNKLHGWGAFGRWAATVSDLRPHLESISQMAGITEPALQVLRELGVAVAEEDSPRTKAIWILDTVLEERKADWIQATRWMLQDPDLFEGTMGLLEETEDPAVSTFLTTVLEDRLTHEQDHLVRKALYHLRQKGVKAAEEPAGRSVQRELFLFGENRFPLWQPLFYFRCHSMYSDLGDLFILQIHEGRDFEPPEQQKDIRVDLQALMKMAHGYTERLKEQAGLEIPFHSVSAAHARYFLAKMVRLLQGTSGANRSMEFLKWIGEIPSAEPEFPFVKENIPAADQTGWILSNPYFLHWSLNPGDLEEFFAELKRQEQGPIILTEARLLEQKQEATREALRKYFDEGHRALWSLAFEKAAFFLVNSDVEQSQCAWALSQAFGHPDMDLDRIPAAAILFERALESAEKQKKAQEQEEKRGSLIVSPEDYLSQRRQERKGRI